MTVNAGVTSADQSGIFVLWIPNAVTQLLLFVLAIIIGTLITAGMLFILKRPFSQSNE